MRKTNVIAAVVFGVAFAVPAIGQTAGLPSVEQVLARASASSAQYVEAFRDLVAEETRVAEDLERDGSTKKRRVIVSNFIVYQVPGSEKIVEFRHATTVDGKPVDKATLRAEEFFRQLQKASSSEDQIKKIRDEGMRFDKSLEIDGYTLFQAVPLANNLRNVLKFTVDGTAEINGSKTIVLKYEQTKSSEFIRVDRGTAPAGASPAIEIETGSEKRENMNERLRGRIWLDADTFAVRREMREIVVKPKGFDDHVVLTRTMFSYRPSDYRILTPETIEIEFHTLDRDLKISLVDHRTVLTYSKFSKPQVTVVEGVN